MKLACSQEVVSWVEFKIIMKTISLYIYLVFGLINHRVYDLTLELPRRRPFSSITFLHEK